MPRYGHYFRLLDDMHRTLVPRTYLELGVFKGKSLALAFDCTDAVGVDPAAELFFPVGPRTTMFHGTSDEFFAGLARQAVGIPARGQDVTFIDGLHLFEQALRDFINAEKWASDGGIVLFHDVLPRSIEQGSREWSTSRWAGDVFKVFLALRKYRPDLQFQIFDVAPTGVGLVKNLDPQSSVLDDRFDEIVEEFRTVELDTSSQEAYTRDLAEQLMPQDDDVDRFRDELPDRPFQEVDLRAQLKSRSRRLPQNVQVLPFEFERRLGLTAAGPHLRELKFKLQSRLGTGPNLGEADISAPAGSAWSADS